MKKKGLLVFSVILVLVCLFTGISCNNNPNDDFISGGSDASDSNVPNESKWVEITPEQMDLLEPLYNGQVSGNQTAVDGEMRVETNYIFSDVVYEG